MSKEPKFYRVTCRVSGTIETAYVNSEDALSMVALDEIINCPCKECAGEWISIKTLNKDKVRMEMRASKGELGYV